MGIQPGVAGIPAVGASNLAVEAGILAAEEGIPAVEAGLLAVEAGILNSGPYREVQQIHRSCLNVRTRLLIFTILHYNFKFDKSLLSFILAYRYIGDFDKM